MADEVIVCADCRLDFPFTESEASFFASKGLTKPRRCKSCRQKRRDAKAIEGGAPAPVEASSRGRTQWVGGGESESPRRDRGGSRKRGRSSDDYGF